MSFELFIAVRYLLAKRKQAFISLISLISTMGVAVGVMALIIVLALMTGLQGEMRDRILGSMAHVYVWHQGGIADYEDDVARLERVPGVVGAAPAILDKALVTAGDAVGFITLKGIDPQHEGKVTDLARSMQQGKVTDILEAPPTGEEVEAQPPGILIGRQLAGQLKVSVGDSVMLTTPNGTLTPAGMMPRSRRLRVAGIYSLGLYEFDSAYGYVSLAFAERMSGKSVPDLIQLKVADIDAAPSIATEIPRRLGAAYIAEDWTSQNAQLFSALWLEKIGMSIAVGLIVLVAALNIVASLVLLVMEKTRDIAILKTMGTSSRRVMRIFMLQGLIIGSIGTALGAIGGVSLCYVLDKYKVVHISQDVYQVSYLPFRVLPWDLAAVIAASIAICFLATLYPSRQASKLDPVQALRFE